MNKIIMENQLIGKIVEYKAILPLNQIEQKKEEAAKKRAISKLKRFEQKSILMTGKVVAISQAGMGVGIEPCLVAVDIKLKNEKDKELLLNKADAKIPVSYIYLNQVTKI